MNTPDNKITMRITGNTTMVGVDVKELRRAYGATEASRICVSCDAPFFPHREVTDKCIRCEQRQNDRLAWRLHTGAWPNGEIDHINGDASDNRIVNLRVVTSSQNKMNRRRPRNNTSGEAGVFFDRSLNRWRATIAQADCKRRTWYASHKVSAVLAVRLIRRTLHGEFTRAGGAK